MNEKWNIRPSSISYKTFNPVLNILETLNLRPNPDKAPISLSIGDPTVFGNLKTHPIVVEAVKEALESGKFNGYCSSSAGSIEARRAVVEYLNDGRSSPDDVIICSGCSCALDLSITALADPGRNILVPRPGFPLYITLAAGLGIEVKEYDLLPERNWEVDINHLNGLIDDDTVAIVLNNPSNPCGSVYSREHLKEILKIAETRRIPIISDEIYDHCAFPGNEFVPLASLTTSVPILACGGLTKRFLVPGWRLGWIIVHDNAQRVLRSSGVTKGLKSLSQRLFGANTVIQGALPKILKHTPGDFFESTLRLLHSNAEAAFEELSSVPGLVPVMPQGAMYMMVGIDTTTVYPTFDNDLEFVETLMKEQSVFCLPGKCFGYENYFRIILTLPQERLREACRRIALFCQTHKV